VSRVKIVVGSLVALAIVGAVGLVRVVDWLDRDIVVDEDTMRTTVERLGEVRAMLDALPTYPGTESAPVAQTDCSADSGDLFQPSVSRVWTLTSGADQEAVVASIAAQLTDAGWTVPPTSNRFGDREPVRFDPGEGWSAVGSLFSTFDGEAVVVEVRIRGARPCALR